jgi:hypothetical protein
MSSTSANDIPYTRDELVALQKEYEKKSRDGKRKAEKNILLSLADYYKSLIKKMDKVAKIKLKIEKRVIINKESLHVCVICFSDINRNDKYFLPCSHCYHHDCIQQWLQESRTCPCCKTSVPESFTQYRSIHVSYRNSHQSTQNRRRSLVDVMELFEDLAF